MAFCGRKVEYPYIIVTHLDKNSLKSHYAFVGLEMMKKYNLKDYKETLKNKKEELKKDFLEILILTYG